MASVKNKQDITNNSEIVVENEVKNPKSVIEQNKITENETNANETNQYTEQNTCEMQLAKAKTSIGTECQRPTETESSKYQLIEKGNSKSQLKKKVLSKFKPRDKKVSLVKDQSNNNVKDENINKKQSKAEDKDEKSRFKKKEGTAQVSGQLYETKMLSFVQLGVMINQDITKSYLASNIDGIGALDDICLRFKSNENDKDVLIFIQTKHRNKISEKTNITMNDVRKSDGDYGFEKYFSSSLKIREKITSNTKSYLFEGDSMNKLDCYYIIYTPAGHSFNNNCIKLVKPSTKVNALIETSKDGVVFQLKYEEVGFLLHDLIEKRFEELANKFLELISNVNDNLVDDEHVESYRPALLYYVIDISEDKGKFRSDFFENNEMYTSMFREKLYNGIIKNKLLKFAEAEEDLATTQEDYTAKNIAKNIGNIIRHDDKSNQFILIDNSLLNCDLFDQTKEETKPASAKDVVEIAGKELLMTLEFNIPVEFVDKKDMKITKLRRFDFLSSSLIKLFGNAKYENGLKLIEVDENTLDANKIKRSVFDQNGGFGSAVGNLLIIDPESKTFKFNNENLPPNALKLWENLMKEESKEDLMSYRLKICLQGFPKASIQDIGSDEYLVKDFLSKFWFYTGQAKQDTVENITKNMIKNHIKADSIPESIFEVSPDAVYLILHKHIEEWWESDEEKEYLTKSTTMLDKAISQLVNNPMLTVLNLFCVNTLKTIGIEFNKDAMKSLNLDKFTCGLLMIISDSTILTGAKLNQHFNESHGHIFMNLNYVLNHFLISFDKILHELESETIKTIIIICESMENSGYSIQALKRLKQKMCYGKIIIVCNRKTHEELNKDDMKCTDVINDENILNDLSLESQEKVLNESIVIFQGIEVNLKTIIDSDSKHIITSDVLSKLVNKEVFEIGKAVTTANYDEIKQFYVHRTLECPHEDLHDAAMCEGSSNENRLNFKLVENANRPKHRYQHSKDKIVVDTKHLLEGLKGEVMIISAPPGMGKSTLLTHLSVETKKEYPNTWIARINLPDYSKQFREWKQIETVVDETRALNFLYQAVTNGNKNELAFANNDISSKKDNISVKDSLELSYFIHCFKTGNVIYLFDGFDEICPHYESVGIQLIKSTIKLAVTSSTVIENPKIWIASRCYNGVLQTIEREFGKSYNLQPISVEQQRIYLKAFWKENLKLEKFTNEQLANVKSFIDYMADFIYNQRDRRMHESYIKPISIPLYGVYAIAVDFFSNEIDSIPHLVNNEMFKSPLNLNRTLFNKHDRLFKDTEASMLAGTPLNLYIAADFFQNEIKYSHSNNQTNKWNLEMNTFSFYDRFLKTKFTKILFEGKKKMDLSIADNDMTHDTAFETFVQNHQKLAFFAIFSNYESGYKAVTTEVEREDLRAQVDSIKLAKEKTGVIDCVVDDVPIFIHRTFAEYFAIQHVCAILTTAYSDKNIERQKTTWRFILDVVIRDGTEGTNDIFNHKLANDDNLSDVIRNKDTERIVYEIISDQVNTICPDEEETAINKAVYCGLRDTSMFLFTCIKKHITTDFFDQFYKYARKTSLIEFTYILGYDDVHKLLRDILMMDYEYVQSILSRYVWMMRDFNFGPFKRK